MAFPQLGYPVPQWGVLAQELVDKSMASSMAHHLDTVASVRRHVEMMDNAVSRYLKR